MDIFQVSEILPISGNFWQIFDPPVMPKPLHEVVPYTPGGFWDLWTSSCHRGARRQNAAAGKSPGTSVEHMGSPKNGRFSSLGKRSN